MKHSKYQIAVFNEVVTTPNNIAVKAGPGSGKTTTIVEAAKIIPYNKTAVFVAFQKSLVDELQTKLPQTIDCSTIHSIGMKALYNHFPGTVRMIKDQKHINFLLPLTEDILEVKKKWSTIYTVDKLIKLCRATMSKPNREQVNNVIVNYALDADDDHIRLAIKAMEAMYEYNLNPDAYGLDVDFQDMIEMPVLNPKIRMPQYDFVFVDEVQDLSALDHLFIKRLVKPIGGRIIGVGDPKQSIYGFRGSDPRSFDKFAQEPNTTILPLSISYRCAKGIVEKARQVYDDIECYEHNQQGIVREGRVDEIQEGDMVLCRNTRPLIDVFLQLIDANKKAYVVGKDMEKGLLDILDNCTGSCPTQESYVILDKLYEKLLGSLKAKGISSPQKHPKAIVFEEKLDILKLLFRRFDTVNEVIDFVEQVFNDENRQGVQLMTIHKSKGLENEIVFVIERYEGKRLIPSQYAVTKDQKTQETNLRFVAYTRAKNELVLLNL